jgi:hypothetical protein
MFIYLFANLFIFDVWAAVAQSVQCLTTDWTTGVRSPTEAEDFSSSLCFQTGSGAHQLPVQWVPGDLSSGVKRGRGVMLTTQPPSSAEVKNEYGLYLLFPMHLHGV